MTLSDLPQIQALPTQEKLQLLDELWVDIAQDLQSLAITDQEKQTLDDRWSHFLNQPSSALDFEDFQTRLRELRA